VGRNGTRDEISYEVKHSSQTLKFAIKGTAHACKNLVWKHKTAQSGTNHQIARESLAIEEFS